MYKITDNKNLSVLVVNKKTFIKVFTLKEKNKDSIKNCLAVLCVLKFLTKNETILDDGCEIYGKPLGLTGKEFEEAIELLVKCGSIIKSNGEYFVN